MTNRLTWTQKQFDNELATGTMTVVGSKIQVNGNVKDIRYNKLMWWAAAPSKVGLSFSGNGLPFANPSMAYENTPNKGEVVIGPTGGFTFTLDGVPNAYYVGNGTLYMPPHMTLKACQGDKCEDRHVTVKIDEGMPFRTLTYPAPPSKKPRDGPLFYLEPWHGARTQEEILRARAYPEKNITPDNFWGKAVPN
jgi:hypothetical protein